MKDLHDQQKVEDRGSSWREALQIQIRLTRFSAVTNFHVSLKHTTETRSCCFKLKPSNAIRRE
eukprot:6181551-Pleurochrysis_carterae.AAC.1